MHIQQTMQSNGPINPMWRTGCMYKGVSPTWTSCIHMCAPQYSSEQQCCVCGGGGVAERKREGSESFITSLLEKDDAIA